MIADRASHTVVAAALLGCLLVARAAAAGDVAAGARLAAARCASCHSSTDTIAQWRAFRERERTAPLMVSLAAELSEQEVDDLAEYYAIQVPAQAVQSSANDAGRALVDRLQCASCHGPALQGTDVGAARLAGQKARYTAWSLQLMRSGTRSHGTAAKPDPLLADLSNAEIESLAMHLASLR